MRRLATIGLVCAALAGCDDDPEPAKLPPVDVGERAPFGQSRAGQTVREDQLLGGPATQGRVGDFKIYNQRVAFVVEQVGPSDGYNPYGGMPIAADLVRAQDEKEQSLFGEIFIAFGGRIPAIDTVEVVDSGQQGGPAVVRVSGPDGDIPILQAASGFSFAAIEARYTIEYSLGPLDDALRITITASPRDALSASAYFGYVMGDGLRGYIPGAGFASQTAPAPYWSVVGENVSYAVFAPTASFTPIFPYQGLLFGSYGSVTAGPGGQAQLVLLLSVGSGDLGPHLFRHALERGDFPAQKWISGRVVDGSGAPVAGARVHVERDTGAEFEAAAFLRSEADGEFSAPLPAGLYRLGAVAEGHHPAGSVAADLRAGDAKDLTVRVSDAGFLSMTASENGAPVPAKFTVQEVSLPAPLPASWGEERYKFEAARIEFSPTGSETVKLAPGQYRVTASRGFEYDRVQQTVTIAAGQTATFAAALTRVVDTTGWVSGDFHLHAAKSSDSGDLYEHKVSSFAAEGLEVPCATEHDYIGDYRPTVAALNLGRWLHPLIGVETSSSLGHINAYPLQQLAGANKGAVNWFYKTVPQIVADIRQNPGGPLVQMNHPMSSGIWATVEFDPATGRPVNPAHPNWSEDFDLIEAQNSSNVGTTVDRVMPRWFGWLNRGKRVGGVGNSDSHNSRQSMPGRPRTYVASATDDPAEITDAAIAASMRDLAMTVSAGPFLTATIAGQRPGKVVVQAGDVTVHVRVQAPLWMGPMAKIELVGNGVVVASVDASDIRWHPDAVLRFEGDLTVTPARDTWYLVRVFGVDNDPMAPVASGWPFAFTNPIYVDRDGNGFTPSL